MSEWQKIETAPRDGTHILGWDGEDMSVAQWYVARYMGSQGYWRLTVCGSYASDSDEWSPTHWMPLPEPPHD